MKEPDNVDYFFLFIGTIEVNGKKGEGKVKKWWDENEKKYKERILSFRPYNHGENDERA